MGGHVSSLPPGLMGTELLMDSGAPTGLVEDARGAEGA